jgi:hypothetical protein
MDNSGISESIRSIEGLPLPSAMQSSLTTLKFAETTSLIDASGQVWGDVT